MKKQLLLVFALFLAMVFVTAAVSAPPEGNVTLKLSGKKECTFDHATHAKNAKSCKDCHHKDEAGKEQKCTTCHTPEGKDGVINAKKAYHKQCIGCHKKVTKGPVKCTECHKPKA